ncbi:Ferrochelatase [Rathayibacter tanaceti]|uniref:Ferrochelatase n=1 Tax=Rathayibacter tanaceti TaxID=1671680 RepID=A0A168G8X7_9MICO|nr:Ferrochelatase [Rathayibacter tanaceti]
MSDTTSDPQILVRGATPAAASGPEHVEVPVAYDAILLAGFGGPEGQDDVIPFLRNVTRGRGIPEERLEEVAHHYRHFGGVSPINAQNRALKAAMEAELARRGIDLPVLWGNRNWAPYLTEAVTEAQERGFSNLIAIATSAYSSFSSCRQYREDFAAALDATGLEGRLRIDKVRQFFDHPAS